MVRAGAAPGQGTCNCNGHTRWLERAQRQAKAHVTVTGARDGQSGGVGGGGGGCKVCKWRDFTTPDSFKAGD